MKGFWLVLYSIFRPAANEGAQIAIFVLNQEKFVALLVLPNSASIQNKKFVSVLYLFD